MASRYRSAAEQALLPGEIFEEILRRLPVKSLLKFRCVSKSWRSLIDSERFVKSHLQNSTSDPTFAHHRVVVNCHPDKPSLSHCSLHHLVSEPVAHFFHCDDPVPDLASSVCIVGSCNGLVCILIDRKQFYLWNPSLRISKKLPFPENQLKHGDVTKFGFGYVESTQDYKIYGILSVFWTTGRFESVGRLYSLKSNSWSTIKCNGLDVVWFGEKLGKFVSGRLHWSNKGGNIWQWIITSFDLKSEEHGMVPLPSNLENYGYYMTLGDFDGCLCMLCHHQGQRMDFWVMNQYGVKESWIKTVTVLYPQVTPLFLFEFYMGTNREILISCGSHFAICNLEDATLRYPLLMGSVASFHQRVVYVESLISFVQEGEQGRQK